MAPGPKRPKINLACDACRRRKIKCDGRRPACSNCRKKTRQGYRRPPCAYGDFDLGRSRHQECTPSLPVPEPSRLNLNERDNSPPPVPPHYYSPETDETISRRFCTAALKTLGLPPHDGFPLVPVVDAPLFCSNPQGELAGCQGDSADFMLPPRRQADELMHSYWKYLYPVCPFLDRTHVEESYSSLFDGTLDPRNESTIVGSLNAMFALSTQLYESSPRQQREASSTMYIQHAWRLLHQSSTWCEPSKDLIQGLLLMLQYLQCTNNAHQTRVVAGTAISTAQSLSLHLIPESPVIPEERWGRKLWQGCVFMGMVASVMQGKPSMTPESLLLGATNPILRSSPNSELEHDEDFSNLTLQIYFVTSKIAQSVHVSPTTQTIIDSVNDRLGILASRMRTEPLQRVVEYEDWLRNWQKTVPEHLSWHQLRNQAIEDGMKRRAIVLCLRVFHARVLLYRPMLARLIFEEDHHNGENFNARLMKECSKLCYEAARDAIAMLFNYGSDHGIDGDSHYLLPAWWHRLFFLHISVAILIAASLKVDVLECSISEISESLEQAEQVLRRHEHITSWTSRTTSIIQLLSATVAQQKEQQESTVNDNFNHLIGQIPIETADECFLGDEFWDNLGQGDGAGEVVDLGSSSWSIDWNDGLTFST